ncbi:GNAT family N-acetyltransferase [Actinoplanes sp. NPDC049265]|uniref:GNAT family N-acetyltransferase n=1 Tax=Actinoplanes sp. NPDC049265 TaxID=3363902 RepID=UPI003712041C
MTETEAEAAARAAGVRIRALESITDLLAADALTRAIWQPVEPGMMLPVDTMRAFAHTGNYLSGAYAGDELVGCSVGFFEAPAANALHSHITGVSDRAAGRGVGRALKMHQRQWCQERGVAAITWTYDPLVARNAYFNLVRLGATPTTYLTNFYGTLLDGRNGKDESDRLMARWDLNRYPPRPVSTDGAEVVLGRTPDGGPAYEPGGGPRVLVAVPHDIETLRDADPDTANRWRHAVREALTGLLADGYYFTGFDRAGFYILER